MTSTTSKFKLFNKRALSQTHNSIMESCLYFRNSVRFWGLDLTKESPYKVVVSGAQTTNPDEN